jgi:BirA family biotin operon repressor/biotin-[acetyl-CoA-carboxylase] ligase
MTWLHLPHLQERLTTRWLGRSLIYCTVTSSTQDVARREAEAGAPPGTVVVADEQTAGRGRLGRSWVSPPGQNLYLTVVLRPPRPPVAQLAMAAPLAVARAVEETTPLRAGIKWPNDVWLGRRKVAGVLIETEIRGDEVLYSLVGIGVNVNMDIASFPELAEVATSLRHELGREVAREEVLAAILNHLEALLEGASPEEVWRRWRERLITLGQQVRVSRGQEVIEGLAEDVDTQGHLLVRRPDGTLVAVEAGDVTLRG